MATMSNTTATESDVPLAVVVGASVGGVVGLLVIITICLLIVAWWKGELKRHGRAPLVMPSISRPEAPRLPSRAEVLNSRPATVLRDAWKQTTRTPVNPATGIPYGQRLIQEHCVPMEQIEKLPDVVTARELELTLPNSIVSILISEGIQTGDIQTATTDGSFTSRTSVVVETNRSSRLTGGATDVTPCRMSDTREEIGMVEHQSALSLTPPCSSGQDDNRQQRERVAGHLMPPSLTSDPFSCSPDRQQLEQQRSTSVASTYSDQLSPRQQQHQRLQRPLRLRGKPSLESNITGVTRGTAESLLSDSSLYEPRTTPIVLQRDGSGDSRQLLLTPEIITDEYYDRKSDDVIDGADDGNRLHSVARSRRSQSRESEVNKSLPNNRESMLNSSPSSRKQSDVLPAKSIDTSNPSTLASPSVSPATERRYSDFQRPQRLPRRKSTRRRSRVDQAMRTPSVLSSSPTTVSTSSMQSNMSYQERAEQDIAPSAASPLLPDTQVISDMDGLLMATGVAPRRVLPPLQSTAQQWRRKQKRRRAASEPPQTTETGELSKPASKNTDDLEESIQLQGEEGVSNMRLLPHTSGHIPVQGGESGNIGLLPRTPGHISAARRHLTPSIPGDGHHGDGDDKPSSMTFLSPLRPVAASTPLPLSDNRNT